MRPGRFFILLFSVFLLIPAQVFGQTPASSLSNDTAVDTAVDIDSAERFLHLAGMVPDHLDSEWDGLAHYAYADLAGQADALGVTAPDPDEAATSDWMWAMDTLLAPYLNLLDQHEEWGEGFGFDLVSVEQTLEFSGDWEESFVLWHGDFDPQRITDALSKTGYHVESYDGVEYWLFHEEMHIDFESPVGRFGVMEMNFAVLLDDETLAFSGSQVAIEALIDAHSGKTPTLAENDDVQQVIESARPDLVSIILMNGSALALDASMYEQIMYMDVERSLETELAQLDAEYGPLAAASVVLIGESAGGPVTSAESAEEDAYTLPDGVPSFGIQIVLAYDDAADADAATRIIPARIDLMSDMTRLEPYTDSLSVESAQVSSSGDLAVIDITPIDLGHKWVFNHLLGQSLRFLFTMESATR